MTDRELLERAAAAAGLWPSPEPFEHVLYRWNPLTDDGDALRLMLACKLTNMGRYRDDGTPDFEATRRAIVRAAAAMDKEMK